MRAKLMQFEYVPPGFEMILEEKDGLTEVKTWSNWFNVSLSDDPETWDVEIHAINKMQRKLGELTVDQRLIRAQMAEFCRRHPVFPQSIEVLCEEIGTGKFSKPSKIGCEGRGLLESLGYHDFGNLNVQRKELFKRHEGALEKWLNNGHPENPTELNVFRFLGQRTGAKESFGMKLLAELDVKGQ